jgi:glycosyltransferase involved in cell wall biosynthesis
VRVVIVRLGRDNASVNGRQRIALRRWIDALIVNSAGARENIERQAAWFPKSAVRMVFNGIEQHAGAGGELGFTPDPRDLLLFSAANLEPRKGFDVLLAAFAQLDDRDTRLIIAGDGPLEGSLMQQAAQLGISERVHFLGFRDDVPALLRRADVFVLSSRSEGMAVSMLEAMAAGKPIVVTAVAGRRGSHRARGRSIATGA